MLKVVLVDDEPSVLEGLRLFVDWNKMGFKITGEASDGFSSLSLILETKPDLVICDIRMPGLNGLELMEKVESSVSPAPKFLVLSGYNDFSYAQKALQLGALGYLSKPLDGEELTQELNRIRAVLAQERAVRKENLELIRYTANQLFNDLMDGKDSERLVHKLRLIFDIPVGAKIRIIQFLMGAEEDSADTGGDLPFDNLLSFLGVENENCLFCNGSGSYLAILHDRMKKLRDHPGIEDYKALSNYINFKINDSSHQELFLKQGWIFISGLSQNGIPSDFYSCARQLEQLVNYCRLHSEYGIVSYEDMEPQLIGLKPTEEAVTLFPNLPFDRVVSGLKGTDQDEVIKALDAFFEELSKSTGAHRLRAICLYRLADVIGKLAYTWGIDAKRPILHFTRSIGGSPSQTAKLAQDMCTFIFEKLNSNSVKPLPLLENEILGYIKVNFTKNLSLQAIAEHFSLPALIISKIVKKKTGKKFNDYCNHLRIEHAKTLFASADYKITVVCEKCGYTDYSYFTEKFKALTGVSPSEYKKKYS